ncbi:MAG: amidohydrolase [Anaerolineae bacterium]
MRQAIVDSHIHFWDPANLQYDWLAEVPAINKAFTPAELLAQAAAVNLEKIVFVQCDCVPEQSIREVEWVSALAHAEPRLRGIVAFAPLEQGATVRRQLQALARFPLVKGIRRLIQSEGPGFCLQPDFVRGVQLLPEFGYSFDICVLHHQLGDVLQLVAQCPETNFVLDHIGKPGIKTRLLEPWQTQISQLATYPNVWCKISGLVTEADLHNWTAQDLQPYIDHIIAAFGIDRVMYGGDWPVSLLATTYQNWLETLATAVADLPEADQKKLFSQNAEYFYRLS